MAIVIANTGKDATLGYLTNKVTVPENLILRLYTNDIIPSEFDTSATYTEVGAVAGYTSKTLTGATWVIAGATASYPSQTWTFIGSVGNIYGYYATRETTGDLVFAERFSAGPYNVATAGDNISVTVNLELN
jgi:hypothetical protein